MFLLQKCLSHPFPPFFGLISVAQNFNPATIFHDEPTHSQTRHSPWLWQARQHNGIRSSHVGWSSFSQYSTVHPEFQVSRINKLLTFQVPKTTPKKHTHELSYAPSFKYRLKLNGLSYQGTHLRKGWASLGILRAIPRFDPTRSGWKRLLSMLPSECPKVKKQLHKTYSKLMKWLLQKKLCPHQIQMTLIGIHMVLWMYLWGRFVSEICEIESQALSSLPPCFSCWIVGGIENKHPGCSVQTHTARVKNTRVCV